MDHSLLLRRARPPARNRNHPLRTSPTHLAPYLRKMPHHTTTNAYAWIRRTGTYTGKELPDPKSRAAIATLIANWPMPGYAAFRRHLATIAAEARTIPIWDGRPPAPQDSLCPCDDDDWHAPDLPAILQSQPPTIDFVWWNIAAIRWIPPAHYRQPWLLHGRLTPGTCGYAIRARALPNSEYGMSRQPAPPQRANTTAPSPSHPPPSSPPRSPLGSAPRPTRSPA